jgi:hypothetical protein
MLTISIENGKAKETGREYNYISLKHDGEEFNRIFIKNTEIQYFDKIVGEYQRAKNDIK